MKVAIPAGKYIVAVSGGIDSVVLLHLLTKNQKPGTRNFTVAHFDHGIREDSAKDEAFVGTLAKKYGLPYVSERAELGMNASEATARDARYDFLRRVMQEQEADKIITAHHQDDLLETMILNMLRGTGRRGLDPLLSSADILRPLLTYSKANITAYAQQHDLVWREDPTNASQRYKRNQVRLQLMPQLAGKRGELLSLNTVAHTNNAEIEALLVALNEDLLDKAGGLVRSRYVTLPHKVASEYMHWWLGKNDVKNVDTTVVTKATIAAKTLEIGKKINLGGRHWLKSEKSSVKILRD